MTDACVGAHRETLAAFSLCLLKTLFELKSLMLSASVVTLAGSHVRANPLSFCLPPFLVLQPHSTARRDRRPPTLNHRPATEPERMYPSPCQRSFLLGVAFQVVVGLALGAGHSQTGDGDLVAP